MAAHQLASRLGKSSIAELIPPPLTPNQPHPYSSNTISVSEAISLMLRHVGIESCRLVPGSEFSTTVVHNLPLSFLEQCCDLLRCSLDEKSWDNALAVVVTLQAVLPAFLSSDKFTSDSMVPLKERVRYTRERERERDSGHFGRKFSSTCKCTLDTYIVHVHVHNIKGFGPSS